MTERKYGDAPAGERTRSAAVPDEPTLGTRPCPHCGAGNHPDASVCEECGEPLRVRARNVRCRHCGKDAPSSLVICPNCGRELKAAPSRWFVWGLPVLLIVLFAVVLAMRTQRSPLRLVRDLSARGVDAVSNLSVQMDPENPLEMTPIVEEIDIATPPSQEELAATVAAQEADDAGNVPNAGEAEAVPQEPAAEEPAATEPVAEAVVLVAPTNTPVAENTPVPTATDAPTPTDVPTATAAPTATATAPATATNTPESSTANPSRTPAATSEPTAANQAAASGALLVPTPTDATEAADETALAVDPTALALALVPTATPTRPPTATPTPVTYTVQPGDTFLGIAGRLGVTADALRTANQLSADDARLLRPGQVLTVPSASAANEAAAAATSTPTAARTTAAAPTATPIPTATPVQFRLAAPQLRSPENNATIGCNSNDSLTWLGVDFMQPADEYIMHLGFVNGRDGAGNETITWVLAQPRPSNRTSWEMDNDLCALAPQAFGRQWLWYVEVVNEQGEAVSPASDTWRFSWN